MSGVIEFGWNEYFVNCGFRYGKVILLPLFIYSKGPAIEIFVFRSFEINNNPSDSWSVISGFLVSKYTHWAEIPLLPNK